SFLFSLLTLVAIAATTLWINLLTQRMLADAARSEAKVAQAQLRAAQDATAVRNNDQLRGHQDAQKLGEDVKKSGRELADARSQSSKSDDKLRDEKNKAEKARK